MRNRPEHQLLRLCVRRRLAPTDDVQVLKLLEGSLDWPYLFNLGTRNQILPLLHECLVAADAAPPVARRALEWRLTATQVRNRFLAQELVRLHHGAAAAGIPMLSFKGPVLATAIYGDLGLRQFGDLDVLVDPASFTSAEKFLSALGYRRARDYGYEASMVNGTTGVSIDLHRHLSPDNFPVSVSFARLWARRQAVQLEGGCVDALSTGDLLLALCIEAVKDARQGKIKLSKISDLAHVLSAVSKMEWPLVEAEARRLGVERVLRFGIYLALDVLEIPALGPCGRIARQRRLDVFVREAEKVLFDDPNRRMPSRWRGDLFHFQIRERWRDKLYPYALYVRRLMTPNVHDRNVVALPRSLSLLYCLIRPVRLARQYGPRFFRKNTVTL